MEKIFCSSVLEILHWFNKIYPYIERWGIGSWLTSNFIYSFKISAVPAAAAPLSSPSAVRSPYPLHMSCHPRPEPWPLSLSHWPRRILCPLRVTGLPLAPEPQVAPLRSLPLSPNRYLRPTWMLRTMWEVIMRGQSQTAWTVTAASSMGWTTLFSPRITLEWMSARGLTLLLWNLR